MNFGYRKRGDTVPLVAKAASELGLAVLKNRLRMTDKGWREWQVPIGLSETT